MSQHPNTPRKEQVKDTTRTVQIQPGTDLNELENVRSRTRDVGQWDGHRRFSKAVFENLPPLLKHACQVLTSQAEQEVFFVGALGVVSGILPNVRAYYRGKEIEANLYAYVLAPYGEGKGALEYARKLAAPIHQAKREAHEQAQKEYQADLTHYAKKCKRFEKEKSDTAEPPEKPVSPPNLMLFVPANNSKSGVYQLLSENEGRAILFETEGDTLADAIKQDYGNFSDGLRKAFHHETISYFRRTNSEYVEIERPGLSVVLSSTFDQLVHLIPTAENGLFSRFLYYELEPSPVFDNVFDKRKNQYSKRFDEVGQQYKRLFDYLSGLSQPVWFELSDTQQQRFQRAFQEQKDEIREYVSDQLGGTVNRMGLICFRIAMLFSILRAFDGGIIPVRLICTDQDFENALLVVEALKRHALSVFHKLPKAKAANNEAAEEGKDAEKMQQKRRCRELYAQGTTDSRKISLKVFGTEAKKSTVYRWTH